jgi:hypothetical protein
MPSIARSPATEVSKTATTPRRGWERTLDVQPTATIESEVEMVYRKYYLDAASTANYGGFTLWNWRAPGKSHRIGECSRVMNIADTDMPIAPMLHSAAIDIFRNPAAGLPDSK